VNDVTDHAWRRDPALESWLRAAPAQVNGQARPKAVAAPARPMRAPQPDVDHRLVRQVRQQVAELLAQRLRGEPDVDPDTRQLLAARVGASERTFTTATPYLHARLEDSSRLAAMAWTTPRPYVVIRRHRVRDVDLQDLVRLGTLDSTLAAFLRAALLAGKNIVVTGLQNAGKTTLIRALANEFGPLERFATIEREYELYLHDPPDRHPFMVPMEAREGSTERDASGRRAGEVTMDELVGTALRMSLRRQDDQDVAGVRHHQRPSRDGGHLGERGDVRAGQQRRRQAVPQQLQRGRVAQPAQERVVEPVEHRASPGSRSGADDALEHGQHDRCDGGEHVADPGRPERGLGSLHLSGVAAGHQVPDPADGQEQGR
jgi:hypothetical protein